MIICPICNTEVKLSDNIINGYHEYVCKECLHEYYLPASDNLASINSELYKNDADYKGDLEKSKDHMYLIQWNHLQAAKYLKAIKGIKTTLDIGTFNGFFVKFMRDIGYDSYGLDFNEDAINDGIKKYSLEGYLSVNSKNLPLKKFDCVSAFEVIEHLEDPNDFLNQISEYLNTGGLLVLSCPNNKMVWRVHVDYPPHHLSRFSPNSLACILKRHGYNIVYHIEQMSIVDLLRNYFGSLLRNPNVNTLKGGEHKKYFFINPVRKILNKGRVLTYLIAKPFDFILHSLGYRYVCQLIIAKKN